MHFNLGKRFWNASAPEAIKYKFIILFDPAFWPWGLLECDNAKHTKLRLSRQYFTFTFNMIAWYPCVFISITAKSPFLYAFRGENHHKHFRYKLTIIFVFSLADEAEETRWNFIWQRRALVRCWWWMVILWNSYISISRF